MARRSRSLRLLTAIVLVLAVVTVGGAAAYQTTRSDDADRTSGTEDGCGSGPSVPAGLPRSDVRLTPFSADSPWNARIESQPTAADEASELTRAFRAGTSSGDPSTLGTVHTWINAEQYSLPIYQADMCDPVVDFEQDWESEDLSVHELRIPMEATPAPGTDANLLVVQPDGHTLLELFQARQISDDLWQTGRIELVSLNGTGMGPDNGVRAFGGSAYGGLIRKWEVDRTDGDYVDGTIDHTLAIALPNSMLLYTSGEPGLDERGYGTNLGYVSPATDQDFDSPWAYRGVIPMGSKVVLPTSVDIGSLGLGPEVEALAVALQRHGGYIVDRAGDGVVTFYGEPDVSQTWLDAARQPDDERRDLDVLRSELVVVAPQ